MFDRQGGSQNFCPFGGGQESIIGGSYQKYHFCHDKHVFVPTNRLSRQAYFCRDKRRVCHDKSMLVGIKTFVGTKFCLSRQIFFVINVLSRKKIFLSRQTNKIRNKTFVTTSILLSQQTKTILVAAPANDRGGGGYAKPWRFGGKLRHTGE